MILVNCYISFMLCSHSQMVSSIHYYAENDPEIPRDDKRPYNSAITSLGVVTFVASADAATSACLEYPL